MFSFFREQAKEKKKKRSNPNESHPLAAPIGTSSSSPKLISLFDSFLSANVFTPLDLIRSRSKECVLTKLSRCAIIDLLQHQDLQVTLHSLLALSRLISNEALIRCRRLITYDDEVHYVLQCTRAAMKTGWFFCSEKIEHASLCQQDAVKEDSLGHFYLVSFAQTIR